MRILVVGQTVPWPEISGARIRLANVLRALGGLGQIDLLVMADGATPPPAVSEGVARVEIVERPAFRLSSLARLRWVALDGLPLTLAGRDFAAVRARFGAWAAPAYDVVWLSRAEGYVAFGTPARGPTVVDLDDLEDRRIAGRAPALGMVGRAQGKRDARLWARLQRRIAASAAVVTVCSDIDRRHLGISNAEVIPNGYTYQAHPVGRDVPGDPPVIAFPGFLPYPPNLDAARLLVNSIAPLIWRRMPAAQVRLVGTATDEIRRLHEPPRVVVTDTVARIESELARADLIAVPIRYGGGTRIKILEAFAHRIPVVSTATGAEGLDVRDGHDLLIADTPEAFADACVRLLSDQALRRALVSGAHRVFLDRYRWDRIHPMIASLAARVAAQGATGRA